MVVVGLTGGLASGKSTVARLLAARGAVVLDADELSRRAVEPGSPGLARVIEEFGPGVVARDGSLDRAALAEIVFANPARRSALESIVHPEVFRLFAEAVEEHRGTRTVLVFDAPLIFETGIDAACDVVLAVSAPEAVRIGRVVRDRGMTEDEARARIAAQMPSEEREARADIVIDNAGTPEELTEAVDALWSELRSRA